MILLCRELTEFISLTQNKVSNVLFNCKFKFVSALSVNVILMLYSSYTHPILDCFLTGYTPNPILPGYRPIKTDRLL